MPDENRSVRDQNSEGEHVFQNPACPGQTKGKSFAERVDERDASGCQAVFYYMEKDPGRQPQKERSPWGIGAQKERSPHSCRRRKPPVGDSSVGNSERDVQVRKDRAGKRSRKPRKTGSRKKGNSGGDDPVVRVFHKGGPGAFSDMILCFVFVSVFIELFLFTLKKEVLLRLKGILLILSLGVLLTSIDDVWAASHQSWVLWEEVIGKRNITALALKTWKTEKECEKATSPDKLPSYLILNKGESSGPKVFERIKMLCLPIGITPLVSVPKPSGLTHRGKELFQ
jgi:hypothetical protein